MINNDIAIDRLKDLILTSVNLTEWQKEQIKEAIRLIGGGDGETKLINDLNDIIAYSTTIKESERRLIELTIEYIEKEIK